MRTPGIRACLTTRPGRGGGTTKNSLANGVPHLVSPPAPPGRSHLFGWAHHPGVRKKRSPLADFLPPLWGGRATGTAGRSPPQRCRGTCLINEMRVRSRACCRLCLCGVAPAPERRKQACALQRGRPKNVGKILSFLLLSGEPLPGWTETIGARYPSRVYSPRPEGYSYRKAWTGSTRIARLAGRQLAAMAAADRTRQTAPYVTRSNPLRP